MRERERERERESESEREGEREREILTLYIALAHGRASGPDGAGRAHAGACRHTVCLGATGNAQRGGRAHRDARVYLWVSVRAHRNETCAPKKAAPPLSTRAHLAERHAGHLEELEKEPPPIIYIHMCV